MQAHAASAVGQPGRDAFEHGLVMHRLVGGVALLPAGANVLARHPDAEVHLLDPWHFALETHADEIAALTKDFFDRQVGNRA